MNLFFYCDLFRLFIFSVILAESLIQVYGDSTCANLSRRNIKKVDKQKFVYQKKAFAGGSTSKLYYGLKLEDYGQKNSCKEHCLVIKEVELANLDPKLIREYENEKEILEMLWKWRKEYQEQFVSHIIRLIAAERIDKGGKKDKLIFVEERGRENIYQFWERMRNRARTQRAEDQIEAEQLWHILGNMAIALEQIHENDIIHLDIKPENFVCMPKGSDEMCEEVKLIDFGSAIRAGSESEAGKMMHSGTPEFMSPEQLQGQKVSPKSDIWSFGVLAYHMLNMGVGSVTAQSVANRYPDPQYYPFQIGQIVAEEQKWRRKVILEHKKLPSEKIMKKLREFGPIKRQKVREIVEKYAKMEIGDEEFFGLINLRENSIKNVNCKGIECKLDEIRMMIRECLNYNPEDRPSAKELLEKYFGFSQ